MDVSDGTFKPVYRAHVPQRIEQPGLLREEPFRRCREDVDSCASPTYLVLPESPPTYLVATRGPLNIHREVLLQSIVVVVGSSEVYRNGNFRRWRFQECSLLHVSQPSSRTVISQPASIGHFSTSTCSVCDTGTASQQLNVLSRIRGRIVLR